MPWDGIERREENMNIKTDVALIKMDIGHVREVLESQNELLHSAMTQVSNNTEHRIRMNGIKDDFHDHVVQDRWMFGLMITMLVGIFIKVVFG